MKLRRWKTLKTDVAYRTPIFVSIDRCPAIEYRRLF
jgi:hypothetical protein